MYDAERQGKSTEHLWETTLFEENTSAEQCLGDPLKRLNKFKKLTNIPTFKVKKKVHKILIISICTTITPDINQERTEILHCL